MKIDRSTNSDAEVYLGSFNDIMFFLLLFFLIVSTMVNPSVIKLMLPKASSGQTISKVNINLSVTKDLHYFLNDKPISFQEIEPTLTALIKNNKEPTVILRTDSELTIQQIVDVLEIGNRLKIKMVLATQSRQ
ncbi:MAG: biopolymer transporter ExbD [Bacteroidota bacterium]|nr:biopolymer transporter ExbD [Bacteroidota bacterium]MDP4225277.1 biopolymer transporter ExbD [Bacteroidota bacterium]MDP4273048.1 biopolymer transporter ExbD [Bacteroidota bacterium]